MDLEQKTIHVRHNWVNDKERLKSPTTKSAGNVPVVDVLAEILEELRRASPHTGSDDFVVYQVDKGKPIAESTIKNLFIGSLERIGIDEKARKEQTRHKSTRMLDNYSHTTESDFEEAKRKLNKRIG